MKFTIPKQASIEFGIFVNKIINQLQENEVENLKLITDMCSVLTIESDEENSDVLLFNHNQLVAIRQCDTIRTLFTTKLRHCWRWDDFSLLKDIIQAVGCPTCELLLNQYEQKLDSQMKLKEIYESCVQGGCHLPEEYEKMVAIIRNKQFHKITKEEYDEIKQFTSEYCGVKPYVLLPFAKASSSSLLIVWLIPSTAVPVMIYMATANVNSFVKKSFVFLQISSSIIVDKLRDLLM